MKWPRRKVQESKKRKTKEIVDFAAVHLHEDLHEDLHQPRLLEVIRNDDSLIGSLKGAPLRDPISEFFNERSCSLSCLCGRTDRMDMPESPYLTDKALLPVQSSSRPGPGVR